MRPPGAGERAAFGLPPSRIRRAAWSLNTYLFVGVSVSMRSHAPCREKPRNPRQLYTRRGWRQGLFWRNPGKARGDVEPPGPLSFRTHV